MISLIDEKKYAQTMDTKIVPWLGKRRRDCSFERVPGEKIHCEYYPADDPKAVLLLVHGFCEGIGKFYETIWYFLSGGVSVFAVEQRGHGRSYRGGVKDPSLVLIKDYNDLVNDLHTLVTEKVKPEAEQDHLPMFLYGHSMGGGVSAVYAERWPEDFDKIILSSPMLGLSAGFLPTPVAVLYARFMILTGRGAEYMPGSGPYSSAQDFINSLTTSEPRYIWWMSQTMSHSYWQTSGPAIFTGLNFFRLTENAGKKKNISRIKAPVLLFQGGLDKTVLPEQQNEFIHQLGEKGELVHFDHAKHEIYRCDNQILQQYWEKICDFLGMNG